MKSFIKKIYLYLCTQQRLYLTVHENQRTHTATTQRLLKQYDLQY